MMKNSVQVIASFVLLLLVATLCTAFQQKKPGAVKLRFPYQQVGLNQRQAAGHLLSRFTYGAKAEDIDQVVELGLEKWFMQQLKGGVEDKALEQLLVPFDDINLSNREVVNKYPRFTQTVRMAIKDGFIHKDSLNKVDRKEYKQQLKVYMDSKGFKPQQELYRQFFNQKILRAAYSNNQLQELLTDFWFNHFNVSLTKSQSAFYIPAYERDVIRPNAMGKFEALLLATAKSPAMLTYLDNFSSTGQRGTNPVAFKARGKRTAHRENLPIVKKVSKKKQGGLNENYAREVMELHTLGVDGGYSQIDVTEAARILTGWTLAPLGDYGFVANKSMAIPDGDFLFTPARHDNGEKTVLGKKFPAGRGYEEGIELLTMLARHPSTAKFISRKLAIRFVNDNPSATLIEKMARTFTQTDGDIRAVMITMVSAREFWDKQALREKTKSPFEVAISAARSLNAEIKQPYQLYIWISKMGQRMYSYQAPTGFPDNGQYWINTGSLLSRMNFGLALASQRIPGIKINLASLNNNQEPESAEAALLTYSKLILPERDLQETVKRLKPMLNEPNLFSKVARAAEKVTPSTAVPMSGMGNNPMLAHVVGVIIGSPEFQRK